MQSSREDHRLPWVICVTIVVKAVTDRVKVVLLVRLRAIRVEQLATGQRQKHALANNHHVTTHRSGYRSKSRNRSPNGGRQRGPGRGGRSHGSDTRYDSRSVDAVQQAQYDDDDDDDSFAQVAYH